METRLRFPLIDTPPLLLSPSNDTFSSSEASCTHAASRSNFRRDALPPRLDDDDFEDDSHQISPAVFLSAFLEAEQDFMDHCTRIFSLDDDSIASLEWRKVVQDAISEYELATEELDQCAPFLRIIDAILGRAGDEEFKDAFPRFKRGALQYTVQHTQPADRRVKTSGRSPDILGLATVEGSPDAPASWGRALLPLEFRMNTRENASVEAGEDEASQGNDESQPMAEGHESKLDLGEEYVVKSESLICEYRGL